MTNELFPNIDPKLSPSIFLNTCYRLLGSFSNSMDVPPGMATE